MNTYARTRTTGQFKINRIITLTMLAVGIALLATSVFYSSLTSAVVGLGLTFWGAILLHIAPSKHVKLELLTAAATSSLSNIERIIADSNPKGSGVYLPPKYLKDPESSLVYISPKADKNPPAPGEIDEEQLYQRKSSSICLTPPGLALSKLFEKELGTSFTRTNLNILQDKLPTLLIENTEIADQAQVTKEDSLITVEITNHVFTETHQETRNLQRTHQLIGCPLCSAIACALAKAAGKPVTIESEEQTQDGKTTKIQYRILEE